MPCVYSCVTKGYDRVTPVPPEWEAEFILFHDGSAELPTGWKGVRLDIPGIHGADLNRYAKMLPHRLGLPSDLSLYVDGNIQLNQDPAAYIATVLGQHRFAAHAHPEYGCAYVDLVRALRIGFVKPLSVWRQQRAFKREGIPPEAGLFECGMLWRRHNDPEVIKLNETWWRRWGEGLRRDQPLLIAASLETGVPIESLGKSPIHDPEYHQFFIRPHAHRRTRLRRLPNRIRAEIALFRLWMGDAVARERQARSA